MAQETARNELHQGVLPEQTAYPPRMATRRPVRRRFIRHLLRGFASRLPLTVRLTDTNDATIFQEGYLGVSGYCVDLEFLRRSQLVVMRDRTRQIVGGYVINDQAPLRTLTRLPAGAARALPIDRANSLVEVACVWLLPTYRGVRSTLLWIHLAWRVRKRRGSTIIFGTEVRGLADFYESFGANGIYAGTVTVDGSQKYGWIYTIEASRWPHLIRRAMWRRVDRKRP